MSSNKPTGTEATAIPSANTKPDVRIVSKGRYRGDKINPRAKAISTLLIVVAGGLFGLPILFFAYLAAGVSNGVIVTALTGSYSVAQIIHLSWKEYAVKPIETGDIQGQKDWIKFVNPIENGYNSGLSLAQIGIAIWDYTLPVLIFVVQIIFDVVMPIFKFIFATAFPFVMEILLFQLEFRRMLLLGLIEVFQALAVSLDGSEFEEDAVNTSGGGSAGPVGGDVDAVPGETTVGGSPLSFLNSFRKVSRFFLRIKQVFLFAAVKILVSIDTDVLKLVDWFMNVVIKFLPTIMKAASFVIDLLDPSSPLGRAIFTGFDLLYRLLELYYGQCEIQEAILKTICGITSAINAVIKKIENASRYNLPNFPNCNINTIGEKCMKFPDNPFKDFSYVGLGSCDEEDCAKETLAIIQNLSEQLPLCADWSATANSTLTCMATVYAFSVSASNYTGNTEINTIAKELCFVLTINVLSQCAQSLPPFGFDLQTVANDICITDRSGLSPPLPPFNDRCACVSTAPLCESTCCNQYARHVTGQIQFYVGGYSCGTLLSIFPQTFWCQFETTTAANITASSDYTFSAAWCQAYRSLIIPACTLASPLATLNAMLTPALIDDYSYNICNQTVGQDGVCQRINTTTSAAFLDFQYSLGEVSLPELFRTMPPLGSVSFVTIPTAETPVNMISVMDIQKYYCYAFFQVFNSTNPTVSSRPSSPYAIVLKYCDISIGEQFGNFDLYNYTYFKLITSNGEAKPIELASIPRNVSPFPAVFGGGAPVPIQQTPLCLNNQTGYNPQEVATQLDCVAQQQNQAILTANNVGESGTSAFEGLQGNAVVFAPAASLGGRGNATVESQQLDQAVAVPTNYEVPSSEDTSSITSNYRTNYPEAPENAGTPVYIRYMNNPAGRTMLSWDPSKETDDNEEMMFDDFNQEKPYNYVETEEETEFKKAQKRREEASLRIINKFYKALDEGLWHLSSQIQDMGRHRMPLSFASASARRGKARTQKIIRTIYDEFSNKTSRFLRTRKLMSTGDPVFDEYVGKFWDKVANTDVQYLGLNEEEKVEFLAEQALRDVQIIYAHTTQVWLVNIYNYLWGENITTTDLDEDGLDYSYELGSSTPRTRCRNTLQEPLRCCGPTTSPYGCCYGIPLCIVMVPDYFYAPITTLENIDNWKCEKFDGFFLAWGSLIKLIVTAVVNISLALVPGDFSSVEMFFLSWVTFENFEIPSYSIQCAFVTLNHILLGCCIIYIIFIFLTVQSLSYMVGMVSTQNTSSRSEWNNKMAADRQL